MQDSQMVKMGMQTTEKLVETGGKILEELLNLAATENRNRQLSSTLGVFKSYVEDGGEILITPISTERVKTFEELAQSMGLTYTVIYEKDNNERAVVQFMEKDRATMDSIYDSMVSEGIPMVFDMKQEVVDFIASLGEDNLDETSGITDESLNTFLVKANATGLKYAISNNEKGSGFTILTASSDYQKLVSITGMVGIQTKHYGDLEGMAETERRLSKTSDEATDTEKTRDTVKKER